MIPCLSKKNIFFCTGWLLNSFFSTHRHAIGINFLPIGFLQARNYAARKGTREKAKKKKVKIVVQKVGFIPHNKRTTKV
jgi:large subunit ribosomal protein L1